MNMFGYVKLDDVLKIVDEAIESLKTDREKAYSKIEGFSISKDKYFIEWELKQINSLDNEIINMESLRTSIEFM